MKNKSFKKIYDKVMDLINQEKHDKSYELYQTLEVEHKEECRAYIKKEYSKKEYNKFLENII